MKTFKIYDEVFDLMESTDQAPDAYGFRGKLLEDKPKGKVIGYVLMRDGSLIECYKRFNILVVLVSVLLIALVVAAVLGYFVFMQPKDVESPIGGFKIKTGDDNNVVSYNGFMALRDGAISVNFQNGDYQATIQVIGEGIDSDPITIEPGGFVESVPATYDTDDGVVNAKIVITTDTSDIEQEVVVEIPENNTPDSPDSGLEGYWKGEAIYGPNSETSE